ncbi:hypothetical protein [Leuconostoc suionicum]|uniref:hypothetical protein n=1 Tax=Leuconostoc suionicum TaxID=1511761 RepID=UPI001B8B3DC3|nr:hypothetical protein [Leuconostoc suionicum]MBS1007778.1 hypothetical protein [Leuconostoc suionicum]
MGELKFLGLAVGSWAEWLGAVGTILTVVVAILVARNTTKDNMEISRMDKSVGLYVDDLRTIIGHLSDLEHSSFLDVTLRGGVGKLNIRERKDSERGLIDRNDQYTEIIGYQKISTIVYRMPERKQKLFKPILHEISVDLNEVMVMNLTDENFNDKRFVDLLIKSVDNYNKIRDKVSSEITKYSVFD